MSKTQEFFKEFLKSLQQFFKDLKFMKTSDRSVKILHEKSQTEIMETLALEN